MYINGERFLIILWDVDYNRGWRGVVDRHPPVNRGGEGRQEPG